jgi:hypothetical protein
MPQPDLATLVKADKLIAVQPDWTERDSEGLTVISPLQIDDIVVEGLLFRVTAKKRLPEEMLTFQLEFHPPGEIGGPLCRLEWRPLAGHSNKGRGPKEWQHRPIVGCHHHTFDLNQQYAAKDVAKGLLPIAVPLDNSPVDFNGLLVLVKKEFRISNIEWLEAPPWEPTLV